MALLPNHRPRQQRHGLLLVCYYGVTIWLFLIIPSCLSFSSAATTHVTKRPFSWKNTALFASKTRDDPIKHYDHDGYKISYRHKPPSPGYEKSSPWLLIHPVGIGLSSWFYTKLLQQEGPAMYAPNLIGCGLQDGTDPFDPTTRGMTFPLGWTKGCETLLQKVVSKQTSRQGVVVVTQGGLAPVGILLASRNADIVKQIIMSSPPTWQDMVATIPESELERNYNFLISPIWGKLAFQVLETKRAIEFFSNAFLFEKNCDEEWLQFAVKGISAKARPPVQIFNAGFCNCRSFQQELCVDIQQPTLVLSGKTDKRHLDRLDYQREMPNCILQQLDKGQNVLPWECPRDVLHEIMKFCKEHT